jgi:hypothetical protein
MTKLDRNIIGDEIRTDSAKPAVLFEAQLESAIGSRLGSVPASSSEGLRRPKSDKGV